MTKRVRTITISVVIIILIGAGFMFLRSDTGEVLLQVESISGEEGVGGTVISLLARLRTVELNKDILSSPGFQSLIDYGVELDEQPIGRTNPFAAVGTDAILIIEEDVEDFVTEEEFFEEDEVDEGADIPVEDVEEGQ